MELLNRASYGYVHYVTVKEKRRGNRIHLDEDSSDSR
jgi:hypothetical protein